MGNEDEGNGQMPGQDKKNHIAKDFRAIAITLPLLPALAMPLPAFALDTGSATGPEMLTLYGISETHVAKNIAKNIIGNENGENEGDASETQEEQSFEAEEEPDASDIVMTTKYGIAESFGPLETHSNDLEDPDEEDMFDGETASELSENEAADESEAVGEETGEAASNSDTLIGTQVSETENQQQMSASEALPYILCAAAGVVAIGAAAMYFAGRANRGSGE